MSDYVDFIRSAVRGCAIVAHRGAWHHAPENSVAGIEAAIAIGCQVVEVDVRRSADGVLFLMHDDTLERMAGRDVVAQSLTGAELAATQLFAGDGRTPEALTDHKIPTLSEALEAARGRIFVDLDLKDPRLFPEVVAAVDDMNMAGEVDLKARVDSPEARAWLAAQGDLRGIAFMAMARLTDDGGDEIAGVLEEMAPFMCETKFESLAALERQRARLEKANISIWVNTLDPVSCCGLTDSAALADPDAIWGELIRHGVSVLQTDEPEALQRFLGRGADR